MDVIRWIQIGDALIIFVQLFLIMQSIGIAPANTSAKQIN